MGLLISTNIIAYNKKRNNKLANSGNIIPSEKNKDQIIIDNKNNNTNLENNNNFILNDFDKILSYEHNDKT
jgi:hypothetical protein